MKELQAFLGMVNFYRRFLPAVAKTLKPLTDALRGKLKSNDVIMWMPECAAAFTAAKHALLQATHLAQPTAGASLSLAVDASATHVGATLQQQLPGDSSCRPLGFFSRPKPLPYAISRVSDPWTARQCRQLAYVAEYTSDICHIAGKEHCSGYSFPPPGHVLRVASTPVSSRSFPAGRWKRPAGYFYTQQPRTAVTGLLSYMCC